MTGSLGMVQVPADPMPMAAAAQERTPLSDGTRIYRTAGAWSKAGVCIDRWSAPPNPPSTGRLSVLAEPRRHARVPCAGHGACRGSSIRVAQRAIGGSPVREVVGAVRRGGDRHRGAAGEPARTIL